MLGHVEAMLGQVGAMLGNVGAHPYSDHAGAKLAPCPTPETVKMSCKTQFLSHQAKIWSSHVRGHVTAPTSIQDGPCRA